MPFIFKEAGTFRNVCTNPEKFQTFQTFSVADFKHHSFNIGVWLYSRKRKQDEAKPACINGSPCVGRIWCWKELNYCITMSDRGIWGLSALSLRLHSYQLQRSSPIGCTHDEASRQPSPFTAIWLTFKHAQKPEFVKHICACVNFCQLVGIFALLPPLVCSCPSASLTHVFARLQISRCSQMST